MLTEELPLRAGVRIRAPLRPDNRGPRPPPGRTLPPGSADRIAGIPYKCPPAPVEFVLMLDGYLRKRGVRERSEITLLSPLNRAFTIESASKLVQPIMERRGIGLETFFNVESVDPSAGVVESLEGEKAEYDLLVLVPPHRGQPVIDESSLGDPGGWLPTDRHTLQLDGHERIFAIGDATNLPISKSGSTAHFEAPVVSSRIASLVHGTAPRSNYGGRVMCFLETGDGGATALRFDLRAPPDAPSAQPGVARREVDVQPPVLGDGPAGPGP